MSNDQFINLPLLGKVLKNATKTVVASFVEPIERPENVPLRPGDRVQIAGQSGEWTYLSNEMAAKYHPRRSEKQKQPTYKEFCVWQQQEHPGQHCCMNDDGEWLWAKPHQVYSQSRQLNITYIEDQTIKIIPRCAIESVAKLKDINSWLIIFYNWETMSLKPSQVMDEESESLLEALRKEGTKRGLARALSNKAVSFQCD